ncbi:DNA invertase Pin-like site-specific DNA recombinase [Orenia metallireducens]|uniref:Site-specific DNA recombinase n=1 Tax=Orenia metallireducens TaxID=1413210 RepID=A0A285HV34_9FIRM|nr:recombinase family protein [Orenia metallireducens]PRX24043.1 DNA invertase Pin-like site-specific DNA recombinase [Orenia metallireducens]SNY38646.1 Site-specific DNA recombinase [Orenia metallireducens]
MKRAIAYIRVSRARDNMITQDTQLEKIKQYCRLHEIKLVDVYSDLDYSGRSTDRPGFQKLFKDIKHGKLDADYLMVYKLDRFARSVTSFHKYMNALDSYGINFISITQQFDTSTPIGRLIRNILVDFAQFESEMIAERVKDNLTKNAADGNWNGGPLPFGYELDEKSNILIPKEDEAEIVRNFFDWYLEAGGSFNQIAQKVNKEGITTSNNNLWAPSRIGEIISHPLYCIADEKSINYFEKKEIKVFNKETANGKNGLMRYNRRTSDGTLNEEENWLISVGHHQGLIPSDKFIQAQYKRKRRSKRPPRAGTSTKGLLAYLLKCGKCGRAMTFYSSTKTLANNRKKTYRYYVCRGRNLGKSVCNGQRVNADKVDELVIKQIQNTDHEKFNNLLNKVRDDLKYSINNLENKRLILKRDLEQFEKEEKNLLDKFKKTKSDRLISLIEDEVEEIAEKKIKIENKLIEIENKLDENQSQIYSDEYLLNKIHEFNENFDEMTFEEKRSSLQSIINKITYDEGDIELDLFF